MHRQAHTTESSITFCIWRSSIPRESQKIHPQGTRGQNRTRRDYRTHVKATDCLRLESMDFTRKHGDGKDAVFSVNSGKGFVWEKMIEPGIEKSKGERDGKNGAVTTTLSSELILCIWNLRVTWQMPSGWARNGRVLAGTRARLAPRGRHRSLSNDTCIKHVVTAWKEKTAERRK